MMLDDMRCFGVLLDSLWASVSGGCKKCQAFGSLGSSRRATMTAPWGEEVGSWMAGRSKVVHFQKCRGCHQKRGFHRVCVWNCVKKVRFFNPVDGIGVSWGFPVSVQSVLQPRPRRKVPKPRALWEPQVLQERPSGASPNHGFTKVPIQSGSLGQMTIQHYRPSGKQRNIAIENGHL
jgi:hypothetical protein